MSEEEGPANPGQANRDLKSALRRARLSEAERGDVIVDLRAAELGRLELLAEELQPVIDQLPPGSDLIDCQIVPGLRPRLWIDMLGYVQMARDKHGYELVSETRDGSQILFESDEAGAMAGKVTDYIAHRLIERDRLAARSSAPFRAQAAERSSPDQPVPAAPSQPDPSRLADPVIGAAPPASLPAATNGFQFWRLAFAFMLGFVSGLVALLVLGLIVTG